MTFQEKLNAIIEDNNSLLCVGLDPDFDKIPNNVKEDKFPQFSFNKRIVDQTADLVCAYKPNTAFYEARGIRGIEELKLTCDYVRTTYPEIPIILDAKRADIGNTNNGYVEFAFNYLQADAITLHPYLGKDALKPFLDRTDKASIILCRTSNPGAGEFQDQQIDGKTLYQQVAKQVIDKWNEHKNCLLVVGATYPKEIQEIRAMSDEMTLLVPGVGAQGGDLEASMKAGMNRAKKGLIISTSRAVIFAEDPKKEADTLRTEINKFRY